MRRGSCVAARFIVITGAVAGACVVITRKLCRYSLLLGDFLCCFGIFVILTAVSTIPAFDIALGSLGRRHCINVSQISVAVVIKLTVAFAAELTLCLILAGGLTAGVLTECLAAEIALVILISIGALTQNLFANITLVILISIRMLCLIRFCSALGTLVPMTCFIR